MPERLSRRGLFGGVAAAGLTLGGCSTRARLGPNGEEQRLTLYNWDTYTGKTTLADFRQATGVDVQMSLFCKNDELFAKLRASNSGFTSSCRRTSWSPDCASRIC